MLLPHDARHNIWFARKLSRNYPFGFPCSFISRSDRDSQLHKFESLSFYKYINLVAGSGSAVTLSPSLSAAPAPPAAPSGPPLRRSGRSGCVVVHPWPSPAPGDELPGQLCLFSRAAHHSGELASGPAVRRAGGTARRLWRPMPSWAAPASFPVSNILPLERS